MSDGFNLRLRRPRPSVVACSPCRRPGRRRSCASWFAEEDALEVRIAHGAAPAGGVGLLRWLTYAAAAVTAAVLLFVVGYILVRGVPALTPDLFQWEYTSENVSLLPALASTVIMALLALALAVPVGVGAAIYLVEYARRGSRFVRLVRVTAETLQGIPSIIYGLFGMLFFVTACGWGLSLLSGACTLAIMVLPVIMRTTEEALMAVPDSYREGGFGLGAGRLRTVARCVLPSAVPGILGGVILALGRCVGEVAALLFTAGTVAQIPDFGGQGIFALFDSCRTLAVHMYTLACEGLHVNEAYAPRWCCCPRSLLNAAMRLVATKMEVSKK
ncbi:MAG: phosphate ABC transporter permease PstA [Adlercreutzia equolifaciens]